MEADWRPRSQRELLGILCLTCSPSQGELNTLNLNLSPARTCPRNPQPHAPEIPEAQNKRNTRCWGRWGGAAKSEM